MSKLLLGLLGAMLSTNQPVAISNTVKQATGVSIPIPAKDQKPADPVEAEFQKLLLLDDEAQEAAEALARENEAFKASGAGITESTLRLKIREKLDPVQKAYDDFLLKHPRHAKARLAYGSFLNDSGDEEEARVQWEKGLELDPKNPAAWNNLANYYGHRGPVEKAFEYYTKAIELNPTEPVYFQNLGTTVFLFRKDALSHYKFTDEQQVFNKALDLYQKALTLAPTNFALASDVAQTYYGIKPFRHTDALKAWDHALKIASDDIQKQGVFLHLARINLTAGKLNETRSYLDKVQHESYAQLKQRITKNLKAATEASTTK